MNFIKRKVITAVTAILSLGITASAYAHETTTPQVSVSALQVNGPLPELPTGIADIKFNELYKMPVGPRGMEPSEKLLSLDNKRVRIIGYMARQETPTPGIFIMAPLPINMGDEDDKFADDIPANSIFVHLDNPTLIPHHITGLISLTGTLSTGNADEIDGRVSYVRLKLDPEFSALVPHEHRASN